MYNRTSATKSTIKGVKSYVAESIEHKVRRIVNNKEPIKDGAPLIYTERKDGVQPSYNIRTDRWDVAVEAMDKVTKAYQAKREERAKIVNMKDKEQKKDETGGQSIDGQPGTL